MTRTALVGGTTNSESVVESGATAVVDEAAEAVAADGDGTDDDSSDGTSNGTVFGHSRIEHRQPEVCRDCREG